MIAAGGCLRVMLWRAGIPALFCCLSLTVRAAEDETALLPVRAEGYADGIGFAARRNAIQAAARDAVAQFAQSLLSGEDLAALEVLNEATPRYVDHVDVFRQEERGNTTYVEADVYLLERALQRDLAEFMLPRFGAPPRVILVIGEQFVQDDVPAVLEGGVAETVLIEALAKKGIAAQGVGAVPGHFTHPDLLGAVQGDIETSGLFVRALNADVIVLGTAVARAAATAAGSNLLRNEAALTLRVFRAFDGKMTETLSARHVVHAADPREGGKQALRDASLKLAPDVGVAAVITVLGARAEEGIRLTIEHPGDRARLEELLRTLQAIPGASQFEELFYSSLLARFAFVYDGPMALLVDQVRGRKFGDAKLTIQSVIGREMHVAFP